MSEKMDYKEYSRYIGVVLEEMAEKKRVAEIAQEDELLPLLNEKAYTLDDVVSAVSQLSPDDTGLAKAVIEDIELRRRPKALLTSISEKVTLYENICKARNNLVSKATEISSDYIESHINYLAQHGMFDSNEVKNYLKESKVLNVVLTTNLPIYGEDFDLNTAVYFLGASEIIAMSIGIYSGGFLFASGIGLRISFVVGLLAGIIGDYRKKSQDKKKLYKESIEYEKNFGNRIFKFEEMSNNFLEQVTAETLPVYNSDYEDKIIESVSRVRSYFRQVQNTIPEIRKDYHALKEAEAGLPRNEETKLLPAKLINMGDE